MQSAKTLQHVLDVEGVALMTLMIRPDNRIHIEKVVSSGFGFSTMSAEWDRLYQRKKLQYLDPVVNCSKLYREPFNWTSVPSMILLSEKQLNFLDSAQNVGLKEGASIGYLSTRHIYKELTITSVCGRSLNSEQLAALKLINTVSAQAMTRLISPVGSLTKREREILGWTCEGKTSWEIAMICLITERTVKYHLKNIYKKLNVENKVQAVVCATKQGLI
ncbi:LuxR C-terminal-related transcriptional regulator [Shewanella psychropiezotolerans]|nr:LuxR C-terminal-related transcriptional regulator [Shewanella psychropiezotolerans]